MILRVEPHSPIPPYEQIRAQIVALVHSGRLADGARLPSIRQLAHDLGLAGGTVARAYRELEGDGVVATRGRHGTVVTAGARQPDRRRLSDAAAVFATEANRLGVGIEDAVGAVRAAFSVLPGRSS